MAHESSQTNYTMFELCLLQARAVRNLQFAVSQRLEAFGITMMEWLLLGIVHNGGKNGLSMTAAATGLDVTMPQVTALSANLMKRRLIRQRTQPNDRRSRHVIITAKGKNFIEDIEPLTATLLDTISNEVGKSRLDAYVEALDELGYYDKPLES